MSLTNKFFVTIVGSMITLILVLGSLVSTSVASYVMSRNSDSTALYMESFLEPYVQSMAGDGVLSAEDLAALEVISQDTALRSHVLSIKVWAPSGRIAFATDALCAATSTDPSSQWVNFTKTQPSCRPIWQIPRRTIGLCWAQGQ